MSLLRQARLIYRDSNRQQIKLLAAVPVVFAMLVIDGAREAARAAFAEIKLMYESLGETKIGE